MILEGALVIEAVCALEGAPKLQLPAVSHEPPTVFTQSLID
jgi:hypothetical protein